MFDFSRFLSEEKALLIAPAGYGKTHTIAECLKYLSGSQLVLTHTHAGVASLKRKIARCGSIECDVTVETISCFASKYYTAFGDHCSRNPANNDHATILEKVTKILRLKIVKGVLDASYNGLFVDEYQDCTKRQHLMILELAERFPTRIFGDPLQAIFDFNDELVDFEFDLNGFTRFPDLETPHRWYQPGNNKLLGNEIKRYRESLMKGDRITIESSAEKNLFLIRINESDLLNPESKYRKKLRGLIEHSKTDESYKNLLLIVPEYFEERGESRIPRGNVRDRVKMLEKFDHSRSIRILEAFDDKDFRSVAKQIDEYVSPVSKKQNTKKTLYKILERIFQKTSGRIQKNTGLKDWLNHTDGHVEVKRKKVPLRNLSDALSLKLIELEKRPSLIELLSFLTFLKLDIRLRIQRRTDLYFAALRAIRNASENSTSVMEEMIEYQKLNRRIGRKTDEKSIGTTLLTKGLEFDTVAILNAHRFCNKRHLYVAISRPCKNLIIFSESDSLPVDSTV